MLAPRSDAHVGHSPSLLADGEEGLGDAGRDHAALEDVLVVRQPAVGTDATSTARSVGSLTLAALVQEVVSAVVELKLVAALRRSARSSARRRTS